MTFRYCAPWPGTQGTRGTAAGTATACSQASFEQRPWGRGGGVLTHQGETQRPATGVSHSNVPWWECATLGGTPTPQGDPNAPKWGTPTPWRGGGHSNAPWGTPIPQGEPECVKEAEGHSDAPWWDSQRRGRGVASTPLGGTPTPCCPTPPPKKLLGSTLSGPTPPRRREWRAGRAGHGQASALEHIPPSQCRNRKPNALGSGGGHCNVVWRTPILEWETSPPSPWCSLNVAEGCEHSLCRPRLWPMHQGRPNSLRATWVL
jgi:hypothetical protein